MIRRPPRSTRTDTLLPYTTRFRAARSQIGILGLGAGSLLRFVLGNTPASAVTVEWNPDVVAVCRACFRLPESPRSIIDQCDASRWLERPRNMDRYQALMVDLYDAQAQGPVRDSVEFYKG